MKNMPIKIFLILILSYPVFAYDKAHEVNLILENYNKNEEPLMATQDLMYYGDAAQDEYKQTVIVSFVDEVWSKERLVEFFQNKNIEMVYISPYYDAFILNLTKNQFLNIQNEEDLIFYFDYELEPQLHELGSDDSSIGRSLKLETLHNAGFGGQGQTIVVLDGVFNTKHEFLEGQIEDAVCFSYDNGTTKISTCTNGVPYKNDNYALQDADYFRIDETSEHPFKLQRYTYVGHGTSVAGIAAGKRITQHEIFNYDRFSVHDLSGIAPDSRLILFGIGYYNTKTGVTEINISLLIPIFDYLLEKYEDRLGTFIVSMSFGGGDHFDICDSNTNSIINNQIRNLTEKGVIFLAAAGNDNKTTSMGWPACVSDVVSVGNVDKNTDEIYVTYKDGSNEASFLDFYGYGQNTYTSSVHTYWIWTYNNYYARLGGTSAATPYVAGSIAVIRSAFPDWNKTKILTEIENFTHKRVSRNPDWSFPIVNAFEVIFNNLINEIDFEVPNETENGKIIVKINSPRLEFKEIILSSDFYITKNINDKSMEIEVSNLKNGINNLELNFTLKFKDNETITRLFEVNNKSGEIYLGKNSVTTDLDEISELRSLDLNFTITATDNITIHNSDEFKNIATTDNRNFSIQKELQEGTNTFSINYTYKQVPNTLFQIPYTLQVIKEELNKQDYIYIATCQALQNIQNNLTAKYLLKNDIDCTDFDFTPIGTEELPFKGELNGNGYTIKNLEVSGPRSSGLFGYAKRASIVNLGIDTFTIVTSQFAGGLIAQASSTTISNILVNNISVTGELTGILIGQSSNSVIQNIIFSGNNLIGQSLFDSIISSLYGLNESSAFSNFASDTISMDLNLSNTVLDNGTWDTELWDTKTDPITLIPGNMEGQFVYTIKIIE